MDSSSKRTFSDWSFWEVPRADGHYNVSATFNVSDLSPFEGGMD